MGQRTFTPRVFVNLDKETGAFILRKKVDGEAVEERWESGASNVTFAGASMRDNEYKGKVSKRHIFTLIDQDDPDKRELILETSSTVFSEGFANRIMNLHDPKGPFDVWAFIPKEKDYIIAMVAQGVDKIYQFLTKDDLEGLSFEQQNKRVFDEFSNWMQTHFGLHPLTWYDLDNKPKATYGRPGVARSAQSPAPAHDPPASTQAKEPIDMLTFRAVMDESTDPLGLDVDDYAWPSQAERDSAASILSTYCKLWLGCANRTQKTMAEWALDTKYQQPKSVADMVNNILRVYPTQDDLPF